MSVFETLWKKLPEGFRSLLIKLIVPYIQYSHAKKLSRHVSNIKSLMNTQNGVNNEIVIIGLFRSTLGHTTAVNLLSQELSNSNITHKKYDVTELLNAPINPNIADFRNPEIGKNSTLIIYLNPEELIFLLWHLGTDFLKGKKIIGYWVWELDSIPKSWLLAKGLVHEIWAPTEFCANVMRKNFQIPVKTVPHPAYLAKAQKTSPDARLKLRNELKIPYDAFLIMQSFTFASSRERKNILGAAKAFSKAFADDSNSFLVLRHLSSKRFPHAFDKLRQQLTNIKGNIILLEANGDINQLYDLYVAADLYISLHRAEGFGLNLAEAMIIGLPVMATNWSGNTEFMDSECVALIPAKLINVKDEDKIYKLNNAKWADADLEYAANKLIELKNNPSIRKKLAENAKKTVRQKLSGGAAAAALEIIDNKIEG